MNPTTPRENGLFKRKLGPIKTTDAGEAHAHAHAHAYAHTRTRTFCHRCRHWTSVRPLPRYSSEMRFQFLAPSASTPARSRASSSASHLPPVPLLSASEDVRFFRRVICCGGGARGRSPVMNECFYGRGGTQQAHIHQKRKRAQHTTETVVHT